MPRKHETTPTYIPSKPFAYRYRLNIIHNSFHVLSVCLIRRMVRFPESSIASPSAPEERRQPSRLHTMFDLPDTGFSADTQPLCIFIQAQTSPLGQLSLVSPGRTLVINLLQQLSFLTANRDPCSIHSFSLTCAAEFREPCIRKPGLLRA